MESKYLTYNGVKYPITDVKQELFDVRGFGTQHIVRFECMGGTFAGFCDDFAIERVIYNDPATVVLWEDGTKTVVKCNEGDEYDPEKGLLLCIAKKAYGNRGRFNDVLRKHVPSEQEPEAFDWEGFKAGKFKVCCHDEKSAAEFVKKANKHGIGWELGRYRKTCWEYNSGGTILYCVEGGYLKFGWKTYAHPVVDYHAKD